MSKKFSDTTLGRVARNVGCQNVTQWRGFSAKERHSQVVGFCHRAALQVGVGGGEREGGWGGVV